MKKQDIFLFLGIILLAVLLAIVFFLFGKSGDTVIIEINGEIIKRLPLSIDKEYLIKSEYGENLIVIKDGQARITSATCPDKVCVHMGILSPTNVLTCIPNGVIVYLEVAP